MLIPGGHSNRADIGAPTSSVHPSQTPPEPPTPPPIPATPPPTPELLPPTSEAQPLTTVSPPDVFGAFDDPLKYAGAAPTESYLQHVWKIWFPDLSAQKSGNEAWTRADYDRRVVELWRPSSATADQEVPPQPQQPPLPSSPSMLAAPLPGSLSAPLPARQVGQGESARQTSNTPPLQPLSSSQMEAPAMPVYRDAHAGRDHLGQLLPTVLSSPRHMIR